MLNFNDKRGYKTSRKPALPLYTCYSKAIYCTYISNVRYTPTFVFLLWFIRSMLTSRRWDDNYKTFVSRCMRFKLIVFAFRQCDLIIHRRRLESHLFHVYVNNSPFCFPTDVAGSHDKADIARGALLWKNAVKLKTPLCYNNYRVSSQGRYIKCIGLSFIF